MAEGTPVLMAHDIHVTSFNGVSPFEDFEAEMGALLWANPGLSAPQKKDLVISHLGPDVRSELACQSDRETAEELLVLTTLKKVYRDFAVALGSTRYFTTRRASGPVAQGAAGTALPDLRHSIYPDPWGGKLGSEAGDGSLVIG